MKTAAIITAAGLSSRMKDFKPLMKLGDLTFAQHLINSFLAAGVSDIIMQPYTPDKVPAALGKI